MQYIIYYLPDDIYSSIYGTINNVIGINNIALLLFLAIYGMIVFWNCVHFVMIRTRDVCVIL